MHNNAGYTMVGTTRLDNFRAAIEEVDRMGISGCIVELGVWRGGAMILAAAVNEESKNSRDLHLFDAFEHIQGYHKAQSFLSVSLKDVRDAFYTFDVMKENIYFHKGLFKYTVPAWNKTNTIAVLRIDGNFYDSYQDALYFMYESIPVGGIIIFDDIFSHESVKRCWVDFKADHGLIEDLNRIDVHSAWFRKEVQVKIDMSKMRRPKDVNKEKNATSVM